MCMVVQSILRLQMTIRAIVKLIYTDRLFSSGFYFHSFDTHKQNIVFFCHRLERECDFNSFKLPKRKSIECDMCLMFIKTDCKIVPNRISISVSGYFCDHWEATLIWIHSSSEHITLVPIVDFTLKGKWNNPIIEILCFSFRLHTAWGMLYSANCSLPTHRYDTVLFFTPNTDAVEKILLKSLTKPTWSHSAMFALTFLVHLFISFLLTMFHDAPKGTTRK